ncbi:uncharacterized protein arhgef5 isoform 2-T2 [Odontesthes bonariensis]
METKRPGHTLFDTLSNLNMGDHKIQLGGKISKDTSSRSKGIASLEQERDNKREENWRREIETEKMRDKARYREMDTLERYERDRTPTPRLREGERERRERERRQEDDRGKNWRPLSNMEKEIERDAKKGKKKGDTFPRMIKGETDSDRRRMSSAEIVEERSEMRPRGRPRREEMEEWERERHRYRERDEIREKEEWRNRGGRPADDERSRQRERYKALGGQLQDRTGEGVESWDTRDRDTARKREKPRSNTEEREARMNSPHRRPDRDIYSDRKERGEKREGRRDARSEGDGDERELRRENELLDQLSRSEGDSRGKMASERDRDEQRYRERKVDKYRRGGGEGNRGERYREADRREARHPDRREERWKESGRGLKNDRREDDKYREERRGREKKERREDATGRDSRSLSDSAPRVLPQSQSSGEWSSDLDSETKYRRDRDSCEERETKREGKGERQRSKEGRRHPERSERRQITSERKERDRRKMIGSTPEQRRMWLEPQRGKNSIDEYEDRERQTRRKEGRSEEEKDMESQAHWGRDGRRVKEEPDERYFDQSSHQGRRGGRNEFRGYSEGVGADGEGEIWRKGDKRGKAHLSDSDGGIVGSQQRNAEGENLTDNTEESDREEEGGSDNWARSRSEGGSEAGWKQDKGRMLSEEDGFVTPSSGGDEEDERRDDEDEFKDCQEIWEGGPTFKDPTPAGFKGCEGEKEREEVWTVGKEESVDEEEQEGENKSKYVFCVIGQTLSRSENGEMSLSQGDERGGAERESPNLETQNHSSDDHTHKPPDELPLTPKRNDDQPVIYNQDSEEDHYTLREEILAPGNTAEGNIQHRAPPVLRGTESEDGMKSKLEPLPIETGIIKRDSQTERLLKEWREQNKELAGIQCKQTPVSGNPYADLGSMENLEKIQPFLNQLNTEAMSPEELEAIRIRMSGAWSMSEEPKRRSQAPHLKWAKDVVREILGKSEEQANDESNSDAQEDNQSEENKQQEKVAQSTVEVPVVTLTKDEKPPEPGVQEEDLMEEFRGMGQNQADMHADQVKAMHVVTHTHDILINTGGKKDHTVDQETEASGQVQLEKADTVELTEREKEVQMYLSVSNTLYKPNSCPILNFDFESNLLIPSKEGMIQEVEVEMGQGEEERQEEEFEERGTAVEVEEVMVEAEVDNRKGEGLAERKKVTVKSSCSFRDLGPEARLRRRGIRKTTERRHGELEEVEEEEGVGRDRRPRVFSTTDDEDDRSKSWGEVELRNVLDTIERRKRNSKIFNASPLYQQYSEAAQNFEILRQSRSDVLSVCEENTPSPARSPVPSPPPARRPLPPLPSVPHPHSWSRKGSVISCTSLPLPEPPKNEGRPSSPRLSISLTQSATLWRELPAVRNSAELEELGEDEWRLQEVRFEVVTSEASYCRSLDIVVEHFVKSKQLGALLATQDRNWLFSRLADVRAISHSFLTKLEERVESDIINFTVCDIIARHCQRFRMVYVPYLTNQSYQDATYQRLMNENQEFKRIVAKLERSPVCQRLPLRSFLVLPFQRITRLKLLVQNIVKRTTPGTAEAAQAIKALKHLEKLIQESNDSITQMKSIESLVSLSAKVDFECRTLPLISQSRRLVREGLVTELMDFSLKDTERNLYWHLFNDYLLVSLQKEGGRFTVIDHSPVSELRVENCRVKLHSLQKNLFRLYISQKALLLRTDTQSHKLRWISALSRPHTATDFSAAQDFAQMQCIRAFVAQQPDELSLEKADVILVHQDSSDNWVEGTKLSDRHRGWVPKSHLENISSSRVRQRNLSDALKLTTATAAV